MTKKKRFRNICRRLTSTGTGSTTLLSVVPTRTTAARCTSSLADCAVSARLIPMTPSWRLSWQLNRCQFCKLLNGVTVYKGNDIQLLDLCWGKAVGTKMSQLESRMWPQMALGRNTNWRGRLRTVDLLNKVSFYLKGFIKIKLRY
jgi:hypothetical protein